MKTQKLQKTIICVGMIIGLLPFISYGQTLYTPLFEPILSDNVTEARRLIQKGADVNGIDAVGITPIEWAARAKAFKVARLLISNRAFIIDYVSENGQTPLHIFAGVYLAGTGNTEIANLLIRQGADVNARNYDGFTPLHHAAKWNNSKTLALLIRKGGDVNARNSDGFTPLHYAAKWNNSEILALLIQKGGDVNKASYKGDTPLHRTVYLNATEAAKLLIESGAYLHAKNDRDRTPLDMAREQKRWEMVSLLEAKQSNTGSSETGESVFEKTWRSIVVIHNGNSQGSGVIIDPNIVATNCHVVEQDGKIEVFVANNKRIQKNYSRSARIIHADTQKDLCLLKVDSLQGVSLNIRKYDTLKVGETVYGIGAPAGLDLTLTKGLISQLRNIEGYPQIQTDAAISPGASGGGLLDEEGNLIGLMTWKLADKDIEGIGFAIPIE